MQMEVRSQPVDPAAAEAAAAANLPELPAEAAYIHKRLVLHHVHVAHTGILPPELLLGPNTGLKRFLPDSAYMRKLQRDVDSYEEDHFGGLQPWGLQDPAALDAINLLISYSILTCQAQLPPLVQKFASLR